jgi:CO dehydrogenase maturation factor
VKVAFVGKGGSGKTTLAALFSRFVVASAPAVPLLAVDADINQHLAAALGAGPGEVPRPALGDHLGEIKEYLRGTNPRVPSAAVMVKTTPPDVAPGCCASTSPTRSTTGWSATPVACGSR